MTTKVHETVKQAKDALCKQIATAAGWTLVGVEKALSASPHYPWEYEIHTHTKVYGFAHTATGQMFSVAICWAEDVYEREEDNEAPVRPTRKVICRDTELRAWAQLYAVYGGDNLTSRKSSK